MKNGDRSVTTLKNIGESRRRAFERVGVSTLYDLSRYYPRAYQNRGNLTSLLEIKERLLADGTGGPFSCILTVATQPRVHLIRRGMSLLKFRAFDETGVCEITYFNQNFLKDTFQVGAAFRFWGKFTLSKNTLQASSLIHEPYVEGRPLPPIVPVYPLTSGLSQKIVSETVKEALRSTLPECDEYLPAPILEASALPTTAYAVKNIHFPENEDALSASKRRLIFDEVFCASVALGLSGGRKRSLASVRMTDVDVTEFKKALPYRLTSAQERCVSEILADMSGEFSMNRMLTGDVGSGKTVVAAAAAYVCLKNGHDCLFMVPTEILAHQHYSDLCDLFDKLGHSVYLLTGSTTGVQRKEILKRLADPADPVLVIGTHALLSPDVRGASIGLVMIDEQHRFGAAQRAMLAEKSAGIGTLVMSATPIPRTLSLVVYGTLDVSRIDELPAGRQPVDTFVVGESYRQRLNAFIKKQVDEGHQVYVVCPAIEEVKEKKTSENPEEMSDISLFDIYEEEEKTPLKAAELYADELSAALPMLNIAVAHGKMKTSEREAIMSRFCAGEVDVLVSTTVIEVGVNVPNATLMVVENADRFGLSQLHQLRGRVGRGTAKSYFVLVSDAKGERARDRLGTIKRCRNGYDIAEEDLKQRGPGDLFGENGAVRQHGKSSLILAAACTDTELLGMAATMAAEVLKRDPALALPENQGILSAANRFLDNTENIMN